jgi:hypothetical protein
MSLTPSPDFNFALNFAEGWLAAGHGSRLSAGWVGARYENFPFFQRPLVALLIAQNLKRRGLKRGFDLRTLR